MPVNRDARKCAGLAQVWSGDRGITVVVCRSRLLTRSVESGSRARRCRGSRMRAFSTGQTPPHAAAITLLLDALVARPAPKRILIRLPVEAAFGDQERNLPEPDVGVRAEDKPDYRFRHPRGDELVLLVEVAGTNSRFELEV